MVEFLNRMMVLLGVWNAGKASTEADHEGGLDAYTVSAAVNKPATDRPENVEPV